MKRVIIISGVIASLIATGAMAHGGKGKMRGDHGPRMTFAELDANGDGQLTPDELSAAAQMRFDAVDADKDGFLTSEEILAHGQKDAGVRMQKRSQRMMDRMDANSDGKLSFDEMSPDADRKAKMFAHLDADGNGTVSEEEFDAMKKKGKHHGKGERKGKDHE